MNGLARCRRRLPVPLRACANLLAIGLCLVLIYIFLGSPALTAEMAYRRAEKANLVGPGEVLAVLEPAGQAYSHLVLAQEDEGVMLYAWDRWNRDRRAFVYLEKDGPLTLAAAPGRELLWLQTHAILPVYLFDNCPEALRAELELTLNGEYQGELHTVTYSLAARREGEGVFAFTIRSGTCLGAEGYLLSQLRHVTGNSAADTSHTEIRAAVRLYDAEGALLSDTRLQLPSALGTA